MCHRLLTLTALLLASPALAVPGPDSVAIVANSSVDASIDLMHTYAKARHIPAGQRCTVDLPPYDDLPITDFEPKLLTPLLTCLTTSGALPRIEAIVLMRGMPRRLFVKGQLGNLRVSLAAALAVARSVRTTDDVPVVGLPPGVKVGGKNAFAATWSNPYDSGPFRAGFEAKSGPFVHRMWLVSFADAGKLIDSALQSEPPDLAAGWLLMKGADKARGVLDGQFPAVKAQLAGLLPNPVTIEPFTTGLKGRHLGAFVVGTASLGGTIEDNTWAPGALVDNVTSLGARPENFVAPEDGGKQLQVAISRWVRLGVAGVHGTVAEPLNNCFPSRMFLVDYAGGATLAEAFWRNLPYVYWMNLVLGDPMTAPFARRPKLAIAASPPATQVGDQLQVPEGQSAVVSVTADAQGQAVGRLRIFIDDQLVEDVAGDSAEVTLNEGAHDVLAVAQVAKSSSGAGVWQSKGWRHWRLVVVPPDQRNGADGGSAADVAPAASPGGDSGTCRASTRRAAGEPWSSIFALLLACLAFGCRRVAANRR